ncbi:MAG TPA: hypothetical protein VF706_05930 [Solirubrobacteraceae bacterium]
MTLERLIDAGPWPQRAGLRALLALARRPRGAALLARIAPPAEQVACAMLACGRYDDPTLACSLGWDASAVVARGRELRRVEGRP